MSSSAKVWLAGAAVATACVAALVAVMMAMAGGRAVQVAGANAGNLDNPAGRWLKPSITAIWYNAHAERWDGILPVGTEGNTSDGGHWLASGLEGGSPTYELAVDTRSAARPDVWWDENRSRLHVVLGHSFESLAYLLTYDATDDSYAIDENVVGVVIPGMVGDSDDSPLAAIVTPNGYWWAARKLPDGLLINRSTDGGSWLGSPVNLSDEVVDGPVTLTSFSHDEVAYLHLFSSDNDGGRWRAYVIEADSPEIDVANWIDESQRLPPFYPGEAGSDDHAAARVFRNHIYVASKVKLEVGSAEPIILLHRTPDGVYTRYEVLPREQAGFRPTRPSLAVDEENHHLYVTYGSIQSDRFGGRRVLPGFVVEALASLGIGRRALARYKSAPLDALHALETSSEALAFQEADGFNSVMTPRHAVNSASQLLLIAAREGLQDSAGGLPIFIDLLEIGTSAGPLAVSSRDETTSDPLASREQRRVSDVAAGAEQDREAPAHIRWDSVHE